MNSVVVGRKGPVLACGGQNNRIFCPLIQEYNDNAKTTSRIQPETTNNTVHQVLVPRVSSTTKEGELNCTSSPEYNDTSTVLTTCPVQSTTSTTGNMANIHRTSEDHKPALPLQCLQAGY